MADRFWNSANGAYTTGFAGVALQNGDRGIFKAGNNQAVTSAHTAQNAVKPALIWWQEGYSANIGTGGGELFTGATKIRFEGGGQLFLKAGDDVIVDTIIRARAASAGIVSVTLNGTGTTDYTNVTIQRGNVAIGANLSNMAKLVIMRDSIVSMAAGSTVVLLELGGGTFHNDSTVNTALVTGGTLNQATAKVATELKVMGGLVNIIFGDTYPLINQYGGHIDMTASGEVKIVDEWNIYGGTYTINELTTVTTFNDYRPRV